MHPRPAGIFFIFWISLSTLYPHSTIVALLFHSHFDLACLDKDWLTSAAVVDRGGQLKALQRADGAGSHTVDASRRKAYTAASTRSNASAILEDIQKNPDAANLSMADGFLNFGRWDADGGASAVNRMISVRQRGSTRLTAA